MDAKNQPGAWLLNAFEQGGVDIEELTKHLPDEIDQALTGTDSLSPDQVNRILLTCAELSGDANFGLRMVELVDPEHFGPYGYLLLNAPTLGDALKIADHYYRMFYRGSELRFGSRGQKVTLEYRVLSSSTLSSRHDNEWTLAFFVNLIREKSGLEDWTPHRTTMTHRAPRDLAEHHRIFGKYCRFDQPVNSIEFSSEILSCKTVGADTNLLRVLSKYADTLLTNALEKENFESRVRMLILQKLESGQCSASALAEEMNMSLSTLKRRLKEQDLSFRQLRDHIVRTVAQQALMESSAPIGEIALRVGYSELSAFDRAFSRLCGVTPSAFRKRASDRFNTAT
jgi:AraC-like DNA-binding protein